MSLALSNELLILDDDGLIERAFGLVEMDGLTDDAAEQIFDVLTETFQRFAPAAEWRNAKRNKLTKEHDGDANEYFHREVDQERERRIERQHTRLLTGETYG